jgi:hypothetical protein
MSWREGALQMKQMVSVLLLTLAPVVFAAPRQNAPAEPASQASTESARPTNRATSHRRHARKHRTGGQHHRRRTTAKSTNP